MWIQKEITLQPKNRGYHLITDEVIAKFPEIKKIKKQETEKKSEKKDSIPITDYKYFFSNGIEKSVDTTLTIYKDYKFNFKLDRKSNKIITSQAALNIIRKFLLK